MASTMTRAAIAILFLRKRRRPSFQKLTDSRMMTRDSFSPAEAGMKSSTLSCRLRGFFFMLSLMAASYLSFILGSTMAYTTSTTTFIRMTKTARKIVVPIIIG